MLWMWLSGDMRGVYCSRGTHYLIIFLLVPLKFKPGDQRFIHGGLTQIKKKKKIIQSFVSNFLLGQRCGEG